MSRRAGLTAFWLAIVHRNMSLRGLVDLVELRWCIERDYHDPSTKSASGIMRAAAGGASIISARYQSQPTAC
jgi:hypothetical protein